MATEFGVLLPGSDLIATAARTVGDGLSMRLWTVDPSGSFSDQITNGGENAEAYWSADGKSITFQTSREGRACDQQFVMKADGTDQELVVHHREVDGGPAWTRR